MGTPSSKPSQTERVEFYRHQLGTEEAENWRKVIDTLFLTLGPQVAAFEKELGEYLVRGRGEGAEATSLPKTAPQVVGTSCCSMGLLIALAALDVGPGDEVITTAMTFAATAAAILHRGAKPVLVDVEPMTGLIDPNAVRAAIGSRTKGIIPVHLYGQMCDMRALRELADRHSLFLLEDSAHGIEMEASTERGGIRPGDLGDAAVFSFYATKNVTSGDGGAVATHRKDIADRLRRLRNHGVSKAAADRHGGIYQHWDLVELGYKANLTDLDAALLRPQLPKVDEKRARREELVRRYEARLRETIGAHTPTLSRRGVPWLVERRGRSSHHLFTIQPPSDMRDRMLVSLGQAGIGTAVNYRAIHTLSYLADKLRLSRGELPIAEEIGDRTISLPLYPNLDEAEQDRVIAAVTAAWREGA